jgi:hypothetical protein
MWHYQYFGGTFCLQLHPEYGVSRYMRNIDNDLSDFMSSRRRRQQAILIVIVFRTSNVTDKIVLIKLAKVVKTSSLVTP